jgi:hypothetical protein
MNHIMYSHNYWAKQTWIVLWNLSAENINKSTIKLVA